MDGRANGYAIASHLFVIPHKNECMKFFQKQKRISRKKWENLRTCAGSKDERCTSLLVSMLNVSSVGYQ